MKVHPSQWDHVYGNGDGRLSLDERGVAVTVETVLEVHALEVNVKTELERHPVHQFRAGEAYRDEDGTIQVRIYPRAIGMTPDLVPYVVGHELGHVALGHLDRGEQSVEMELDANRFAGAVLAEMEEDLELVIRTLRAKSGDSDTHGTLEQNIAALREGYRIGLRRILSPPAPAADAFVTAFANWISAISANRR